MYIKKYLCLLCCLGYQLFTNTCFAACANSICALQGGIHYCDSSAGRYVCRNGEYSTFYCTRHAVMELENIQGCCLWAGGVLKITPRGVVICRDLTVSELCSRENKFLPRYSKKAILNHLNR
jgi:hypothetical protein